MSLVNQSIQTIYSILHELSFYIDFYPTSSRILAQF